MSASASLSGGPAKKTEKGKRSRKLSISPVIFLSFSYVSSLKMGVQVVFT
jgi:hypothetical protein